MADHSENRNKAKELRRKAEKTVASQPPPTGETDVKRLLHELQVHKVELEIQNEELQRANVALQQEKTRIQNLIQMTPAGYFHLDEDDCFWDVNDAWLKMHRYHSRDEIIGKHFSILQVDSGSDSALKHLAELHSGNPVPLGEFTCRRKDGSVGHHVFSAHPVLQTGRAIGFDWFIIDISERVQEEEKRLKLEGQLQQALKVELVGRLAGGVAHDYNNMLSVIIGHTELARMKVETSSPVQKDLEQIMQAANRSRDITQQLLAFARKQIIEPKVLNLNEPVENMLKMLRNLLGENIELQWNPKANLWPIEIDPSQLDQILANLCVNARDAIDETGHLVLETDMVTLDQEYCDQHADLTPGDYVKLSVADDGRGMDEETLAHIFEPFFTTKGVGEGTGLGMAMTIGVVKQSNGYINVTSVPGKGTTFEIFLPRYKGTEEGELVDKTVEEVCRGRGETILLVEDETAIVAMATAMLENLGYTVLAASTPTEALDLEETHRGDIQMLLTDVVMPEMNGRELAARLMKSCPELKSLFMSGYTSDVISQHGVLNEEIHFIQKPFSMIELSVKVKGVLDRSS